MGLGHGGGGTVDERHTAPWTTGWGAGAGTGTNQLLDATCETDWPLFAQRMMSQIGNSGRDTALSPPQPSAAGNGNNVENVWKTEYIASLAWQTRCGRSKGCGTSHTRPTPSPAILHSTLLWKYASDRLFSTLGGRTGPRCDAACLLSLSLCHSHLACSLFTSTCRLPHVLPLGSFARSRTGSGLLCLRFDVAKAFLHSIHPSIHPSIHHAGSTHHSFTPKERKGGLPSE